MVLGDPVLALPEPQPSTQALDLDRFTDFVGAEHLPHAVIIDCSASDAVADRYEGWLARGIHVHHPQQARRLGAARALPGDRGEGAARFRYESTVGAGLPVITTLRDLIDTGDEVLSVEGIFSGTLAYLFNRFDGSQSFSALVRAAKELGYTEPDPRDDLSGRDVARKLVILARENGWPTELAQVELESLVPEALAKVPLAEFLERLGELDAPMASRLAAARRADQVLALRGAAGRRVARRRSAWSRCRKTTPSPTCG